ncbi:unnamed protein product, partial [Urochloa humidicola]
CSATEGERTPRGDGQRQRRLPIFLCTLVPVKPLPSSRRSRCRQAPPHLSRKHVMAAFCLCGRKLTRVQGCLPLLIAHNGKN